MDSVNYKAEGLVYDIQRYSIHDGPGIRTIVFLKGCPLSCLWCCNPESQKTSSVVMYDSVRCVHCERCLHVCKQGAISPDNNGLIDREKCIGCGECTNVCPTGALVLKGERMTVEQLITELKKDRSSFRKSGGGITLSGGEPLLQWKFATELLKACKSQGWNTAMETTGFGSAEAVESIFPHVDLVLLDVKAIDDDIHKRATGVSNELIHKNAKRITEITKAVVRVPTVPGINDSEEEFIRICNFAKSLNGVTTIHLLPYHTYGENKYSLLNREYPMGAITPLPKEKAERLQEVVQTQNLKCLIGG